jgi:hypothetical protein
MSSGIRHLKLQFLNHLILCKKYCYFVWSIYAMYYYRSIRLLANLLGASKALVVFGYLGVHFEFVPTLYKTQTWKKEKESLLCLQKNGRPLYKEEDKLCPYHNIIQTTFTSSYKFLIKILRWYNYIRNSFNLNFIPFFSWETLCSFLFVAKVSVKCSPAFHIGTA